MKELKKLKYVGKKTLDILLKHNITSIQELLETKPKYIFFKIDKFKPIYNDKQTFLATYKGNFTIVKKKVYLSTFEVVTNNTTIKVVAFNMPFLKNMYHENDEVILTGTFQPNKQFILSTMIHKKDFSEIKNTYNIDGIKDKNFLKIIDEALKSYKIKDFYNIKDEELTQLFLKDFEKTYYFLHMPKSIEDINIAYRNLKIIEAYNFYQEIKNIEENKEPKSIRKYNLDIVRKKINALPFELTTDQKNAVNDIFSDFKKEYSISRLLLGDVGSGKTVVAGIAAVGLKTVNMQTVLMAPTVLLANQHAENIKTLFPYLNVELVTSNVNINKVSNNIKNGFSDIVIGTTSLLNDDIIFNNLGLVIIDEQHKFGVLDRKKIIDKSQDKDVLYLTATPIPRTLFITVYGNKELSVIRQMPKNRKPVISKIFNKFDNYLITDLKMALANKENIYIVSPAILESDDFIGIENIKNEILKYFDNNIYILHGLLSKNEQETIINEFKNDFGAILISTTMVEVGIDIKQATRMIVFQANRFGLSQLHQLRGRVGRSDIQSYCYLEADNLDDTRLNYFCKNTDGFKLSQYDLKDRGPGHYLGIQQSGIPKFKWIDFKNDFDLIVKVRNIILDK